MFVSEPSTTLIHVLKDGVAMHACGIPNLRDLTPGDERIMPLTDTEAATARANGFGRCTVCAPKIL